MGYFKDSTPQEQAQAPNDNDQFINIENVNTISQQREILDINDALDEFDDQKEEEDHLDDNMDHVDRFEGIGLQ